ncbi:Rz-like spanin [Serratia phage 92A1]|nr:Rz-like spanin [Serratia phage 92A1]
MKKLLIGLLSLALVGCAQEPQKPSVDPLWPKPIKTYSTEWKVIVVDGSAYMALPYAESQEFRIWLEDIHRYVQQSNDMICYYRAPLKEAKCE